MPTTTLPQLPFDHSYDSHSRKLTIRGATTIPREVYEVADAIEILDLSGGQLTSLPDDLGRLQHLRIAFFSNNPLGSVPRALANCPRLEMVGLKSCGISQFEPDCLPPGLRGLILTDNQLTSLPASLGRLSQLQKLMLAGNRLADLPPELAQCHNLELLRLPANRLTAVPDWLWTLPRLAWYSDAANPISYQPPTVPVARSIAWSQLVLGEKLGESAKNVVYRARLAEDGSMVAVKLYGGVISTDGYADDEVRAGLLAGTQAGLIPVLGVVPDAPDGRRGLVMELVPPAFGPAANPPDFTTLTRDVPNGGHRLSLAALMELARNLAATLAHLHRRGIMHGDVYAHNILANQHGLAFMGDFGAASLYGPTGETSPREWTDVCGFGYLLEDLLAGVGPTELADESSAGAKLRAVQAACVRPVVRQRPTFADISELLQN